MESIEKECSALGGLFQQIINDMKSSSPVWEDFLSKSTKLHTALKATIIATGAFLEAFQKVADIATNTKGATREIGSALTRLCMRHRSIENRLKAFNSAIMDMLVNPLQDKMEDWRKAVVQLDKDHSKEYKKARAEIKRASSDTIRLQKKMKKGKSEMQNRLDTALQEVNDKYLLLEETERNAVRMSMIEERGRFCQFVYCLKPVVDEEIHMLTEVTHLQEICESLCRQAADPSHLPPASEQVILDMKGVEGQKLTYQTPPSSPGSLGSRKSSMCSISSIASSSSGSTKSHSPSHHFRQTKAVSQHIPPGTIRLSSISSQDSGFTSQDTLFLKAPSTPPMEHARKQQISLQDNSSGSGSGTGTDSGGTTPSPSFPVPSSTSVSTWANWPDPPFMVRPVEPSGMDRPHTISSGYERSHNRPTITSQTFEPPDPHAAERPHQTAPPTPNPYAVPCIATMGGKAQPPSSLLRHPRDPVYKTANLGPPAPGPKPRARPVRPPTVPDFNSVHADQIYVNMNELANMAAQKQLERRQVADQQRTIDEGTEEEEEDEDEVEKQAEVDAEIKREGAEVAPSQHHHHQQQQQQQQQQGHKDEAAVDDARPGSKDGTQGAEGVAGLEAVDEAAGSHGPRTQRSLSMPAQFDDSVLARVIEELNNSTAALHNLPPPPAFTDAEAEDEQRLDLQDYQQAPNSRELAEAIRELEASTAALQMNYDEGEPPTTNNRLSLQCSSGYGTMSSTPACSENTIASEDLEFNEPDEPAMAPIIIYKAIAKPVPPPKKPDKYFTLPHRREMTDNHSFKVPPPPKRPVSMAGVPIMRRGSLTNKPPPPLRRTASITGSMAVACPQVPSTPTTPTPQDSGSPSHHRRTFSDAAAAAAATAAAAAAAAEQIDTIGAEERRRDTSTGGHGVNGEEPEDLPPPPPPEELALDTQIALNSVGRKTDHVLDGGAGGGGAHSSSSESSSGCNSVGAAFENADAVERREPGGRGRQVRRQGSIVETHGNFIASLNERFSTKSVVMGPQVHPPMSAGLPLVTGRPPQGPSSRNARSNSLNRNSFESGSSDDNDITPTGDPPQLNLLYQIQHGVRLKRTSTNDRSAPKFK